jgi:DNA-binding MarR family transcriptional regulator
MSDDLETFELLMEEASRLIARGESLHTPRFDFGTGIPLFRSEIHTIETIGKHPGINVTRLAERMGVTKGAVSQMLKRLVHKKLISKRMIAGNEKEVAIELTDLGRTAFEHHKALHLSILAVLRDYYGDTLASKLQQFRGLVGDLSSILSLHGERIKDR